MSHSWKGGEQSPPCEARQSSSEAPARQHRRTLPPRLWERNELVEDGGTFLAPLKLQRKSQCWRRGRRAEGGLSGPLSCQQGGMGTGVCGKASGLGKRLEGEAMH